MEISDKCLDLVRRFEGLQLKAYYCPGGVLTIGYGHTGPDVHEGKTITKQEADILLRQDMRRFESSVNNDIAVAMSQGMFDAMVSFSFNVGAAAFRKSTLRRRVNAGKLAEAANEFLRWNKAGGKVLAGLTRRRQAERELFLS